VTDQRCCFCGTTPAFPHRKRPFSWQDVAGRVVCDDDCAELERARQAADGDALVHSEVDGLWGLSPDQNYARTLGDLDDLLDAMAIKDMS
jgi:hypothetical protein